MADLASYRAFYDGSVRGLAAHLRRLGATRDEDLEERESNDFLRKIWAPKPLITAGAYTRELAIKTAEEKGDIIAVGRYFISNPDLPLRWRHNLPLTEYNRDTFYLKGDASPTGYTDYPFAEKTAEQSKL